MTSTCSGQFGATEWDAEVHATCVAAVGTRWLAVTRSVPEEEISMCKHWARDMCMYGEARCRDVHVVRELPPCRFFQKGTCTAAACPFPHYVASDRERSPYKTHKTTHKTSESESEGAGAARGAEPIKRRSRSRSPVSRRSRSRSRSRDKPRPSKRGHPHAHTRTDKTRDRSSARPRRSRSRSYSPVRRAPSPSNAPSPAHFLFSFE
jgi:hypothetical protein